MNLITLKQPTAIFLPCRKSYILHPCIFYNEIPILGPFLYKMCIFYIEVNANPDNSHLNNRIEHH